jgi:hypothetical protein
MRLIIDGYDNSGSERTLIDIIYLVGGVYYPVVPI